MKRATLRWKLRAARASARQRSALRAAIRASVIAHKARRHAAALARLARMRARRDAAALTAFRQRSALVPAAPALADTLASVTRAARMAGMQTRIIRIYTLQSCEIAGFFLNSENSPPAPNPDPFAVTLAVGAFASAPSPATASRLLASLAAYDAAVIRAHDAIPAPTLAPNVPGFDPEVAPVRFVPVGELEWQTRPPIGTNPADLCEMRQPRKRKPAPTVIVPKRERVAPNRASRKPARPLAYLPTLTRKK